MFGIDSSQIARVKQLIIDQSATYLPKLAGALLVLVIGWAAIGLFKRFLRKGFEKKKFDKSLSSFLLSVTNIGLKILLLITVASMIGIQMTSFIAILGAAGLAVGFALQGSLSNFAGGVLILVSKPFKVGESIEAKGHRGNVKQIDILYTTMETFSGETVVIPNGNLANSDIKNYSRKPIRRIELTVGISYDSDLKVAKKLLNKLVSKEDRVLEDPKFTVDVNNLGDSSVDFRVTMWTENKNFLQLKMDLTEKIKLEFDKAGLDFPFPSLQVYLDD
jgi:small conductance mechanosensitive channel